MTEQPIWTWPFEEIQKTTVQVNAGADLTPDVWFATHEAVARFVRAGVEEGG